MKITENMKEEEDPLLPSWRDSGDKMGDLESVTVRRSSPMSRRESGAGESSTFKTDLVTHKDKDKTRSKTNYMSFL